MATKVIFLPSFVADVEAIADYISKHSSHHAGRVTRQLLALAESLSEFPRSGHVVEEWDDESIRETRAYSYRLLYQVRDDTVLVFAVIHAARQLPEELRSRLAM